MDRIGLSEGEDEGLYLVEVRFVNVGNVHLEVEGRIGLFDGTGAQVLGDSLEGRPGPILPLGFRSFSGTLDVSELDPGYYTLRALFPVSGQDTINGKAGNDVLLGDSAALPWCRCALHNALESAPKAHNLLF